MQKQVANFNRSKEQKIEVFKMTKQTKSNAANSNRNANRTTHAVGVLVDMKEQKFTPFEVDIPYVRSIDKAAKSVAEIMQLDGSTVVSISELQQTETQRVVYDMNALYLSDAEQFADEETAKARAKEIGAKAITGTIYRYNTQVFFYDMESNEYATQPFEWVCGSNFTALDARAMLAMRFEEMHKDCRAVALHSWGNQKGYKKHEETVFYVASADLLKGCERIVKHRANK